MKSLIISGALLLFFISCSVKTSQQFTTDPYKTSHFKAGYFSENIDYVYHAKINAEAFQKQFSGILAVKKTAANRHRVVFVTNLGSRIFDFEIGEQYYYLHYILPLLNKKPLLNLLKRDFAILLHENYRIQKIISNSDPLIYEAKVGRKKYHLYIDKETHDLQKIVHPSAKKPRFLIYFNNIQQQWPRKITMEHSKNKIRITLSELEKNNSK